MSILGSSNFSADKMIERPARQAPSRNFPKSVNTRVQLISFGDSPERQFATFAHDLAPVQCPPAKRDGHKAKFPLEANDSSVKGGEAASAAPALAPEPAPRRWRQHRRQHQGQRHRRHRRWCRCRAGAGVGAGAGAAGGAGAGAGATLAPAPAGGAGASTGAARAPALAPVPCRRRRRRRSPGGVAPRESVGVRAYVRT